MIKFYAFILRAILGAAFAVFLIKLFHPEWNLLYVVALWVFLVGTAYFFDYLRKRKQGKQD